ncbi:MAG: FHA domain-containing protein [Chloroflexi bacterium]|nr:MAG: FHA domain-containing protein [Chloroflexota bacterium]
MQNEDKQFNDPESTENQSQGNSDQSQSAEKNQKPSDFDTNILDDKQNENHDPFSTQVFDPSEVAPLGAVELVEAPIPDRLRIIMPDASVLVFDEFTPYLIIGRKTRSGKVNIDIDLMPYDAGVNGVSRVHAMIMADSTGMMIKDLNSTNGTFLNGQQLQSSRPYPLRSGDRVKCGNLKIEVIFEDFETKQE